MRRYLTAALCIIGFLLLLGAAGDSDLGTGVYIFERACAGVALLAAGALLNRRHKSHEKHESE